MPNIKNFRHFFPQFLGVIVLAVVAAFTLIQFSNLQEFTGFDETVAKHRLKAAYLKVVENQAIWGAGSESQDRCELSSAQLDQPLVPERLVIPRIGLDLPVIAVPLIDGTWAVNDHAANWAEGTSLIDPSGGNVGLFGHDRTQAFLPIKQLVSGDEILVYARDYLARYQASLDLIVDPKEIDIFYPTEAPILTLATCDGKFSQKRFVARAELVSIQKTDCEDENI